MPNDLHFHYQLVIHDIKEGIHLHEAFSTRAGYLHSLNPIPVENADKETEQAVESDSTRYKPVLASKCHEQMKRWQEEVNIFPNKVIPHYDDDEEEIEEDYYKESGEVLDLMEYIERNR